MLRADEKGRIFEQEDWEAVGASGFAFKPVAEEEMIPAPEGTCFHFLPQRIPLGRNRGKIKAFRSRRLSFPVAAVVPPGYVRILCPAFIKEKDAGYLPFFAYTACGYKDGRIWVAARAVDNSPKWNPRAYNISIQKLVQNRLKIQPDNRLLQFLSNCAVNYNCYTAQNIFYKRWEGGIPVSPYCNARCRGCISAQDKGMPPPPQKRIDFVPSFKDAVSIAREHILEAEEPILSFGQGCEGEPSLEQKLIIDIISSVRRETLRGIININTNGGKTENLKRIFDAGLDSVRISINSFQQQWYNNYFRPQGFDFEDVCNTIRMASKHNVFCSLNLLVFPGATDSLKEMEALFRFIEDTPVDMIQLRNLNIDPDLYKQEIIKMDIPAIGIAKFMEILKQRFPGLSVGSFTPYFK